MAVSKLDVIEQYLDNNGDLLAGGLIYTYVAETSTPLATYSDNASPPNANTNPIVLDASGRGDIWFTQGSSYKVIVQDADGVTLKTIDKIEIAETTAADIPVYFDVVWFRGGTPAESELLYAEVLAHDVTFPANFVGSFGLTPTTLPAAEEAISVLLNDVVVGTFTCSTLGVWTKTTTSSAEVVALIGDTLKFTRGATVTTLEDAGMTVVGVLA